MAETDINKVVTIFHGISARDVDLATQHIDHKRFVQHNPCASDGVDGLLQFISQSPRDQLQLNVIRAFQDGPYVVTQAKGQRSGRNVFFDIFRFEDGLVRLSLPTLALLDSDRRILCSPELWIYNFGLNYRMPFLFWIPFRRNLFGKSPALSDLPLFNSVSVGVDARIALMRSPGGYENEVPVRPMGNPTSSRF